MCLLTKIIIYIDGPAVCQLFAVLAHAVHTFVMLSQQLYVYMYLRLSFRTYHLHLLFRICEYAQGKRERERFCLLVQHMLPTIKHLDNLFLFVLEETMVQQKNYLFNPSLD